MTRATTPFPELAPHEGSWIIRDVRGRVVETWERGTAFHYHRAGYEVLTIGKYLGDLNKAIREANAP